MKDYKCRFVSEYKNFRVRQLKEDIRFRKEYPATNNKQYENECIQIMQKQIDRIEKCYMAARAGLITVDECMHEMASVGSYHDPEYYDIP